MDRMMCVERNELIKLDGYIIEIGVKNRQMDGSIGGWTYRWVDI